MAVHCLSLMETVDLNLHQPPQSIVNLTSHLLTEEVVDTWISAGNISSNVQALLMAIETVAEALVDVANQTDSGIVTILTDNIRKFCFAIYCELKKQFVIKLLPNGIYSAVLYTSYTMLYSSSGCHSQGE